MRTDREPAGCAEVADKSIEAGDILVVFKDPAKFVEEGVLFFVGEEAGGHGWAQPVLR